MRRITEFETHTHTCNDATLHLKHKMTTKTMLNGQKTEKAQNYIKIITTITFFSLLVFQLSSKIQVISRYPNQNSPEPGPTPQDCDDRNNRTKHVYSLCVCLFVWLMLTSGHKHDDGSM